MVTAQQEDRAGTLSSHQANAPPAHEGEQRNREVPRTGPAEQGGQRASSCSAGRAPWKEVGVQPGAPTGPPFLWGLGPVLTAVPTLMVMSFCDLPCRSRDSQPLLLHQPGPFCTEPRTPGGRGGI